MRNVDDGPDGLNEKAFDRVLATGLPKAARSARKPKPFDAKQEKERLFDQWSAHRKRHGCGAWPGMGCPIDNALLDGACTLVRAEYAEALFDGIREACRG